MPMRREVSWFLQIDNVSKFMLLQRTFSFGSKSMTVGHIKKYGERRENFQLETF
jgi:putative heme iron utilization protein